LSCNIARAPSSVVPAACSDQNVGTQDPALIPRPRWTCSCITAFSPRGRAGARRSSATPARPLTASPSRPRPPPYVVSGVTLAGISLGGVPRDPRHPSGVV